MRNKSISNRVNNSVVSNASSVKANASASKPKAKATGKVAEKEAPSKLHLTAEQVEAAKSVLYINEHLADKSGAARLEIVRTKTQVQIFPVANLDKSAANRARFSIKRSADAIGMKWVEATKKERAHYEIDRKAFEAAEVSIKHLPDAADAPATDAAATADGSKKKPATTNGKPKAAAKGKTSKADAPSADATITVSEAKARAASLLRHCFGEKFVDDDKILSIVEQAFAV